MKTLMISLLSGGAILAGAGCCPVYKDALCKLSDGSAGVANHYEGYVQAEQDPATKNARMAEVTQFRGAIEEAKKQCKK
jgi:hypothetical protein